MSAEPHARTPADRMPTTRMAMDCTVPSERDDPRNLLLEAFEGQVRAMIDYGLEAPLRARLARLLPPPVVEADLFAARAAAAPAGAPAAAGPECELELAALLTDCARFEKFKMSAASHACIARIKARAARDLDAAKSLRTSP